MVLPPRPLHAPLLVPLLPLVVLLLTHQGESIFFFFFLLIKVCNSPFTVIFVVLDSITDWMIGKGLVDGLRDRLRLDWWMDWFINQSLVIGSIWYNYASIYSAQSLVTLLNRSQLYRFRFSVWSAHLSRSCSIPPASARCLLLGYINKDYFKRLFYEEDYCESKPQVSRCTGG